VTREKLFKSHSMLRPFPWWMVMRLSGNQNWW